MKKKEEWRIKMKKEKSKVDWKAWRKCREEDKEERRKGR